ncbi:MAG TPA: hypothetical protein VGS41_06050, partial [Chthonomonadales bacterium]|nr:hypothetical protein [Chthonomonadales bacterium]
GAGSGKGYLDAADAKNKQADQLVEALRSGYQLTEQQRNVLDPRVQQAELDKAAELDRQKAGQKQYEGIAANERSYQTQQKGWLDTARSLFSQPELYTGVGSSMSQFVNRVKAAYANDPNGATYQAVLAKVNAASILNTIGQQKYDAETANLASARIFAGQIDQAQKVSPGIENTLEGNRALVELQTRTGETYTEFARQARDYLKTHKYLDAGFDERMSKWVEKHPLLSQAEISNPSLLGVPYMPPDRNTPQKAVAWAQAMGMKEGDPMRTADGRLGRVPRLRVPVPVQAAPQQGGVAPANAATP